MFSIIQQTGQNMDIWESRIAAVSGLLLLLLYSKRGWCELQAG